jgi:transcriptional regulator with PAS, ATPase and Fis domain
MKFDQFQKSELCGFLDRPVSISDKHTPTRQASLALDNSEKLIWISSSFTFWTGYTIKELRGKKLTDLYKKIFLKKERSIHGKIHIVPERTSHQFHQYQQVLEGINVQVSPYSTFEDFILYSAEFFPRSVDNLFAQYTAGMYGIIEKNMAIIEANHPLYHRLLSISGKHSVLGSSLLQYLNRDDWNAWEKAKKKFEQYTTQILDVSNPEWKNIFNSRKDRIQHLPLPGTISRHGNWNVSKGKIEFTSKSGESGYFLLNRRFNFFSDDFRIEAHFKQGNGGIILCGSELSEQGPDENGYLVSYANYSREKRALVIRRNFTNVAVTEELPINNRIIVEKIGHTLQVYSGTKRIIQYRDSVPFYNKIQHCRLGFFAETRETINDLQVFRTPGSFDPEKITELKQLVRFKDNPDQYFEFTMFPGEFWQSPKTVVCFHELSDLLRSEKKLSEYKAQLDQARSRLLLKSGEFHGIVGRSLETEEVIHKIRTIAPSRTSVLITGETGVGKDVLARAIHDEGDPEKPFVKVDCASLPVNLIESELFGHEKGAFTGAVAQKKGKFELAHTGTLFLDEVGNLTPELQVKLLRFLNDRAFERLGGTKTITSDVRILAATNADLEDMVTRGTFRPDLLFRLKVITVHIPALRERKEDIYPLIEHFIHVASTKEGTPIPHIDNDALPFLMQYSWPGNIRELKNIIEQTMLLHRSPIIRIEHLPPYFTSEGAPAPGSKGPGTDDKPAFEAYRHKAKFTRAFKELNGNVLKLSEYFGLTSSAIYYYIKKFGLTRKDNFRAQEISDHFKHTEFTIHDVMHHFKISFPTAKKELRRLAAKSRLRKRKKGRSIFYRF